jgi:hypothetical protein
VGSRLYISLCTPGTFPHFEKTSDCNFAVNRHGMSEPSTILKLSQ